MQIVINLKQKLEKTANEYFQKAKKSRKKADKAREIVLQFKKKLAQLEKKHKVAEENLEKAEEKKRTAPVEWYEKFRWFISSEGFLCIGGRDATSNEIVIKKHTDKDDIVFHTEAPGSPFFVIKTEGKKPSDITKQEVADAAVSFSKAWKLGLVAEQAYAVSPDQVSKTAQSGEYMQKGAFMIRGKRIYYQGKVTVAVGKLPDTRVMAGPEQAVKANCKEYMMLIQGRGKPSDAAKKIAKKLNVDIDEALRSLPGGTCQVK